MTSGGSIYTRKKCATLEKCEQPNRAELLVVAQLIPVAHDIWFSIMKGDRVHPFIRNRKCEDISPDAILAYRRLDSMEMRQTTDDLANNTNDAFILPRINQPTLLAVNDYRLHLLEQIRHTAVPVRFDEAPLSLRHPELVHGSVRFARYKQDVTEVRFVV